MNLEKLKIYTVEQVIDFIQNNDIPKNSFIKKIDESSLSLEEKKLFIQKLDFSYGRINEPLEVALKLFYLFAPFGLVNMFLNSKDLNFERFKKYKYLKKMKQYFIFSTIGIIMYIFLGIIAGLTTRYHLS